MSSERTHFTHPYFILWRLFVKQRRLYRKMFDYNHFQIVKEYKRTYLPYFFTNFAPRNYISQN